MVTSIAGREVDVSGAETGSVQVAGNRGREGFSNEKRRREAGEVSRVRVARCETYFFDTPALELYRTGVALQARVTVDGDYYSEVIVR